MGGSFISELKRRNVLRIAAAYAAVSWLLIQVAETVLPVYGFGDDAVRTVVTVLVIGFIPAVILAWVFEWTPTGIQLDGDAAARTPGAGKWLDRVIVVVLVIAVIYFAVDKFVIDPAQDTARIEEAMEQGRQQGLLGSFGDKSIAVCPFDNLSPDPNQQFFATGIAEELLNLLARIPELRVISRTSSFEVCGQEPDIPTIAARLDVSHVLEGSVRKDGDRIRITAQLIEGPADAHIWSDTWDRELGSIFDIQDEISSEVVSRLEVLLVQGMPRSERTDPLAYALVLEADNYFDVHPDGDPMDAIALLKKARELDPEYVAGLLALNVLAWEIKEGWERNIDEMTALERETYAALLRIAPDDPRVVARRAWENFEIEHDWPEAARLFERAVALAPGNATLLHWAGAYASIIGQFDLSLELTRRALSIDPLCHDCVYVNFKCNYYAKYLGAAIEAFQQLQSMGDYGGQHTLGKIFLLGGQPEQALESFSNWADEDEDRPGKAMALYSLGRLDEARRQFELAEAVAGSNPNVPRVNVAEAAAWMGDIDAAFEWLEKAHGDDDYRHFFLDINEPVFEVLHDDPRWQALARKVKLSDEQRAAIEFDPHLPE